MQPTGSRLSRLWLDQETRRTSSVANKMAFRGLSSRSFHFGYFCRGFRPSFRKKTFCLLLTVTTLAVLAVTSKSGTITPTAAVRWSSPLLRSSSSPEQGPTTSGTASETTSSQGREVSVTRSNTQTISRVTTLEPVHTDGAKGSNNYSRDTAKELFPQAVKQGGEEPGAASHGDSGVKVNPEHSHNDSQTMKSEQGEAGAEDARGIRYGITAMASWDRNPRETMKNTSNKVIMLRQLSARLLNDINRKETNNTNGEIRHVFFLKVHKAASTTVMNILYRFAVSRHLNVMLPRHANVFSENSKVWTRKAIPRPEGAAHFDILCNHLVFNEPPIRYSLGKHARFIGIVRAPFQQFLSAFHYYRNVHGMRYLRRIPGKDPVATYLQDPLRFDPWIKGRSFTHNRMSFDFGMNPLRMSDKRYIDTYITYLERTFDLVMIKERFDESMVLMKRLLGWRLEDVLYVKNNVFTTPYLNFTYSSYQKHVHRTFNAADYRLYENFKALFQSKVDNEGELFKKEVAAFVSLREQVEDFCRKPGAESISLAATDWTPVLQVVRTDCLMMTLPEIDFVNFMKIRQYGLDVMFRTDRRLAKSYQRFFIEQS